MQLNPYLNFPGTCEQAFNFYAKTLDGKITATHRFGESPMAGQVPAEWKNKIMHTSLIANGQILMGSDGTPDRFQRVQGFAVSLNLDTAEAADRIFAELAAGGKTEMPIQETFWALRFGMYTDRFGMPWMVNCHKLM
jgi:PhnB protein